MNKVLSSKKGASSILVILLLVVLVVFGVAALTTALSNVRLGQKVVDFNQKYYEVEGVAWQRFAEIDRAVSLATEQSEENAADAIVHNLNALDFDMQTSSEGHTLIISYETWHKDGWLGLLSQMALDTANKDGLQITQWKEIQ